MTATVYISTFIQFFPCLLLFLFKSMFFPNIFLTYPSISDLVSYSVSVHCAISVCGTFCDWWSEVLGLFFHKPTHKYAECSNTHCSKLPLKRSHWALCSRFYFIQGHLHLRFIYAVRNTAGATETQKTLWQWQCQTHILARAHTHAHTHTVLPAGPSTTFNDTISQFFWAYLVLSRV